MRNTPSAISFILVHLDAPISAFAAAFPEASTSKLSFLRAMSGYYHIIGKVACLLFKQYSGALLLTIQCLEVHVVRYREDCDAPPDISQIERDALRMRITGAKLNISARVRRRWAQRWLFRYLTSALAILNLWKSFKDVSITDGKKGNSNFTRWPKELETSSGLVFHWHKIREISCIAKHEFRFKRSQLQILGMPCNQLEIPFRNPC